MNIDQLRQEYSERELRRRDLAADPVDQFARWFDEAIKADLHEPNAMSLSTVSSDGQPSLRTVLLKFFDADGLVFFTNLGSTKALELASNPRCALLFPWLALQRQVIVKGTAEKISKTQALRYFCKRPRGSQLGAWVSRQSSVISSRSLLEAKLEEMKARFADGDVPIPSFWGGYRVRPDSFEFWQGRPARLHDRFLFTREDERWRVERLAP